MVLGLESKINEDLSSDPKINSESVLRYFLLLLGSGLVSQLILVFDLGSGMILWSSLES